MLEDVSIDALQAALRGLSQRQQAVGDNIANVNTPYFQARRVEFEGSLKNALGDGANPLTSSPTVVWTDDPSGLNENNVDVNAETLIGIKTQLAYELALRATGDRFTLVRTAVKGV
ncbi:flagellar basal body protein [Kineosporia sp. R_H_3]|uniref:flagellar basal body rod protein FlgB n=1 Tax=Kineosporia sp. R_H_3 TaxID=1961848 RepID=UPI000B4C1401|nr:flagellar basal body protein [Kineosporia sp. R_H_3]